MGSGYFFVGGENSPSFWKRESLMEYSGSAVAVVFCTLHDLVLITHLCMPVCKICRILMLSLLRF